MDSPRGGKPGKHNKGAKVAARSRKETIQDRRRRVFGTPIARFPNPPSQQQQDAGEGSDRRRRQVLLAQRAHRQRTLDYIDELEDEVHRLRASTLTRADEDRRHSCSEASSRTQCCACGQLSIAMLIEAFNGQIAPGVYATSSKTAVFPYPSPSPSERSISPPTAATQLPINLEVLDPLTRMLFYNFSENVAPTLVNFDGPSNGYRTLILPLAYDTKLVRFALLAASANHLRFKRPQLQSLALTFQSIAIEKLSVLSKAADQGGTMKTIVFATIILLLITDMMNGGLEFSLLCNMVKSWIEATDHGTSDKTHRARRSDMEVFLSEQLDMVRRYAEPLMQERHTILGHHGLIAFTPNGGTFKDKMLQIFRSLSEAIKQTCCIYYYHMMHDSPPPNVGDLLCKIKVETEHIPAYTPGEHALVWVYFVGAAESSNSTDRIYFTKRLMGVFERGSFNNATTAFLMLHHIWSCQHFGRSWTKTLRNADASILPFGHPFDTPAGPAVLPLDESDGNNPYDWTIFKPPQVESLDG